MQAGRLVCAAAIANCKVNWRSHFKLPFAIPVSLCVLCVLCDSVFHFFSASPKNGNSLRISSGDGRRPYSQISNVSAYFTPLARSSPYH
jgi:hypothetical protein